MSVTITGSVTLANLRLSSINGAAFVDFSSAAKLTPYVGLGALLTLTDSASKTLTGYIQNFGTGETYGTERLSSWSDLGTFTIAFTTSGKNITRAAVGAVAAACTSNAETLAAGALYKFVQVLTLTSGTAPWVYWATFDGNGGGDLTVFVNPTGTTTWFVNFQTVANNYLVYNNGGAATDFASTPSIKQIHTPSVTGVTIVSASGGATNNWTTQAAGFNYNDANNYTYSITFAGYPTKTGMPTMAELPRLGEKS